MSMNLDISKIYVPVLHVTPSTSRSTSFADDKRNKKWRKPILLNEAPALRLANIKIRCINVSGDGSAQVQTIVTKPIKIFHLQTYFKLDALRFFFS